MKHILFILSVILFTGCSLVSNTNKKEPPALKDIYLFEFDVFVTHVELDYKTYDPIKWKQINDEYNLYAVDYKPLFDSEYTKDDLKKIGAIRVRYHICKSHDDIQKVKNVSRDIGYQLKGVIDQLGK